MFLTRAFVGLILVPIVIGLIVIGGWLFELLLILVLSAAAIEFVQMMRLDGFEPPLFFTLILIISIATDAIFPEANLWRPAVAFTLISSLTWQLAHKSDRSHVVL